MGLFDNFFGGLFVAKKLLGIIFLKKTGKFLKKILSIIFTGWGTKNFSKKHNPFFPKLKWN